MTGILVRIPNQGNSPFGFIESTAGLTNIFVHVDNVHDSWGDIVKEWKKKGKVMVEFELEEGPKGPRANKVRRLE